MNKKEIKILSYIVNNSEVGEAVVMDKDELFAEIKEDAFDKSEVDRIVKNLNDDGLILLKYTDGKRYCIEQLSQGKLVIDAEEDRGIDTSIKVKVDYKKIAKTAFAWGAVGGGIIALAITALAIVLFKILGE